MSSHCLTSQTAIPLVSQLLSNVLQALLAFFLFRIFTRNFDNCHIHINTSKTAVTNVPQSEKKGYLALLWVCVLALLG